MRYWLIAGFVLLQACEHPSDITWGHASTEPASQFVNHLANQSSAITASFATSDALLEAAKKRTVTFALIEQPAEPIPDLTVVSSMFPSVLHLLTHRSISDCTQPLQLDELLTKGAVYPGPPGSTGYQLLDLLGQTEWLPPMSELTVLPDPFSQQPDIFFQFGGLLPIDAARRLTDYCLASIGDPARLGSGAWAEGVSFRFPHLTPFILPAGLYPRLNPEPVLTLAVNSLLVTHSATDTDLVYDTAQLVHQSATQLSQYYPLAGQSILDTTAQRWVIPLHPGATRFAQRDAPTFVERYAELAAFLLTASLALSSVSVTILRSRRQRRKDRIDDYLTAVLLYREKLKQGTAPEEVKSRIESLQREVTELVVGERIDADSTYVAFISLSNQILSEVHWYQEQVHEEKGRRS